MSGQSQLIILIRCKVGIPPRATSCSGRVVAGACARVVVPKGNMKTTIMAMFSLGKPRSNSCEWRGDKTNNKQSS